MQHIRQIFHYIKKFRFYYLAGILALLVVDLIQLAIPKVIGLFIDQLKENKIDEQGLLFFSLQIVGFSLIIFLGRFFWRNLIFGAARKIESQIRENLFGHLEKLSASYFQKNKTGNLMSLFTNDLNAVRMAIGPGFMMAFDGIIMTIFVVVNMSITIHWKLTLAAFIPLPVIAAAGILFGRVLTQKFKDKQEAFSKLSDFTQESFSGIRVIKAFVREWNELKQFGVINQNNFEKNARLIRLYTVLFPFVEITAGISFMITLFYGGYLQISGEITLGQFMTFNQYIGLLIWPMIAFGWCINIFSMGSASSQRIYQVLSEKPSITDELADPDVIFEQHSIDIDHLSFHYTDDHRFSLKNINIHLPAGKTLAITGSTGSGKTTLVNLLVRIFNPPPDSIRIGGVDVHRIPLARLRECVGMVTQDSFLFSDTIHNNIDINGNALNHEMVIEAGKSAYVHHNIVDFPDQYETVIGERGVTLSGGQKQRVSLARTLLKNPPVMILDDTFSAVDTETENRLIRNIRAERTGKTNIIISHRLSGLAWADEIIYLEDGQITERGTHQELIDKKGKYYNLYKIQEMEAK